MDFECSNPSLWREALSSYQARVESLNKPDLVSLDDFYRNQLPSLIYQRNPNPYITTTELSKLMRWKLTRGKWRPRLLDFVSSLDESSVESASQKAFKSLPDLKKATSELTVLKGVGPATASAVLAAYAPDVAPFMSDEAMEACLGNCKDYSLKQYLLYADKLQAKAKGQGFGTILMVVSQMTKCVQLQPLHHSFIAKEVVQLFAKEGVVGMTPFQALYGCDPCTLLKFIEEPSLNEEELAYEGNSFTPSDVERALWSSAIGVKLQASESAPDPDIKTRKGTKRKQKH